MAPDLFRKVSTIIAIIRMGSPIPVSRAHRRRRRIPSENQKLAAKPFVPVMARWWRPATGF
jgi:hypothetical protein